MQYHQGSFVGGTHFGESNIVTRKNGIQMEGNERTGRAMKSTIEWLSDCEYELSNCMKMDTISGKYKPWLPGQKIYTRIVTANNRYCIYESKMTNVSTTLRDTLWIK